MYDFKLNKNEEIKLISDDTLVYGREAILKVTCIITNQRLLFLDYPGAIHNSAEDLRISGRMTYIRKKEIIGEMNLRNIVNISKENTNFKIETENGNYTIIKDKKVIKFLNSFLKLN